MEINRYYSARFRVESLLVKIDNYKLKGETIVRSLNRPKDFLIKDLKSLPMETSVVKEKFYFTLFEENHNCLETVLAKVKLDMYKTKNLSKTGLVIYGQPIKGGLHPFQGYKGNLIEEARTINEFMIFDRIVIVNPSEWGENPVKQTGRRLTAGRSPGNNYNGHYLPPSAGDKIRDL